MIPPQVELKQFLDELASAAPTPGGGSAAAYTGALGAALVAMVSRLTIGRKNYQQVNADFEALLPRAETLRQELFKLMQADAGAYAEVMTAYQQPRDTEDNKNARAAAIQAALKRASEIPLRVAQACSEVLDMAAFAAEQGNKNAASDGGAAAVLAEAGLRAALLNVEINLGLIRDQEYVSRMRDEMEPLKRIAAKRQTILDMVQTRL